MSDRNEKVLEILREMRRQWFIVFLKGMGLAALSAPIIALVCVMAGVEHTQAPNFLALVTCLLILFNYTGPRYADITEEYRGKALEELEKIKNENTNSADVTE